MGAIAADRGRQKRAGGDRVAAIAAAAADALREDAGRHVARGGEVAVVIDRDKVSDAAAAAIAADCDQTGEGLAAVAAAAADGLRENGAAPRCSWRTGYG